MNITDKRYFPEYMEIIGRQIPALIHHFDFTETGVSFDYMTKASAVYSSNIEGNSVDLNSYMNHELSQKKFKQGHEIEEIDELVAAYHWAQAYHMGEESMLKAHEILSKSILIRSNRGKYRTEPVGVFGKSGMAYLAVEPEFVAREMSQLTEDADKLLGDKDMSAAETFYHASLLHLRLAHIHPFRDGNGRLARLVEKWFLSKKLGREYWKIPSEEYYKAHQQAYYETMQLGVNFYELDYSKCLPFLTMLPSCLKRTNQNKELYEK